jgi:uncharacterized protein (DUF885 family)
MRTLTPACLLALSLLFHPAAPAAAAGAGQVARLAAQNALFDEQFESDMQLSPLTATAYGDYRYNDRLDDVSLATLLASGAADRRFLARIRAISTAGFAAQDLLSHRVFERMLNQRIADARFRNYEMPLNQMEGACVDLADLPLSSPFETVKHYEDYLSRLRQIPRYFAQTEGVLRAGMKDRLMPVRFLLEKVPAQCAGVVDANPFLGPLQRFPDAVSAADRERLTAAITAVVTRDVLPAYRSFGRFVGTTYAPAGRTTLSVASLPGGERRYRNDIVSRTTVDSLSPDQIHELGLREITRIEAEMLVIAKSQGFADLDSFRDSLRTNPKYIPTSGQQILEDFRRYIAQMQPKLPELFGYIPGTPVTVEPIPEFQTAAAVHYQAGTPDGSRPGRVVVPISDCAHRSLINDEVVAYHEGIPGHHMQSSVAIRLTGLPKFRQHVFNSGYIEGWALYSERLGKEVGFYQDPVSDYGRLRGELWRAVRLVVDTGLHAKGWSREQVVQFMRDHAVTSEPEIQTETDRYIAWPAQSLSYKLGQLKILELRERARTALGTRFDIREFHDEILGGGVLPLDILDARISDWIRVRLSEPGSAAPAPR